jgi:hypothetical protein
MSRLAVFFAFLALVLQGQAQTFSRGIPASVVSPEPDGRQHGIPASVVSPEPDGRLHGVPASVLSPTPLFPFVNAPPPPRFVLNSPVDGNPGFNGHRPSRRFGDGGQGHHRRHPETPVFVPVPLYYPVYSDAAYPIADPNVDTTAAADAQTPAGQEQPSSNDYVPTSEDALRAAYLQGARDALSQQQSDSRYGGHYMDSRESAPPAVQEDRPASKAHSMAESAAAAPAKDTDWPATVFIFKDGHQIETRNFAIMGQTLYDFSSQGLRKVQLADLDKDATIKANDDRGIQVKLP